MKRHILTLNYWSSTWRNMLYWEKRMFLVILGLHFCTSVVFFADLATTVDESDYFGYSLRWARQNTARYKPLDDSKTPVAAPALTSLFLKKYWPDEKDIYGFRFLRMGRHFMYIYLVLLAFSFLFTFKTIWPGSKIWPIPLVLLLYDPMVFSYSSLVGSDIPVAALLLATLYCLLRYSRTGSIRYFLYLSLFTSLTVLAKASMVYLIPMLALAWLFILWKKNNPLPWKKEILRLTALLGIVLFIINATYWFGKSFFPVKELPRKSAASQALYKYLAPFENFPVPLPYDYVSAFDELKLHAEWGGGNTSLETHTFMGVFVHGKYFESGPVWYYYFYSFWFKLPLLTIGLCFLSLLIILWQHKLRYLNTSLILVYGPPLLFLFILSFTNPFQIGLRHALMVYPVIYLFVVPAIRFLASASKYILPVLMILNFTSLAIFWPNILSYTNEFLQPKKALYKYFGDSNINYGHVAKYLNEYLHKHSEYKRITESPAAGKYAVDVSEIYGPRNYPRSWWIRHFEPSGLYRHSVLLYEITEQDLEKLKGIERGSP